jgi:hypothetical protein
MRKFAKFAICFASILVTLGWLWPAVADAQIYVYPRRPSQTNVRWFDFDWHSANILIGPEASGETIEESGPRLHFHPDHTRGDSLGEGDRWDWSVARTLSGARGDNTSAAGGRQLAQTEGDGPPPDGEAPPPDGPEPPGEGPGPSTDGEQVPGEEAAEEDLAPWSGGVRLFFYEREREVAERAAGFIEQAYRELVEDFDYVPRRTFPYFLYSSYHEFLQTNLFPIQEGVLGVTSPRTLEVTLPYFGDHSQFHEVSKHELAHQFTIQKVRTFAEQNEASSNPLMQLPLWFIEGLAEYYTKGLDPQTDMLVRDLIVNPQADQGYVLEGFFEDRPYSFLWTYKLGQARCAFLEETYGEGTIQRLIEESYRMVGKQRGEERLGSFPALLTWLTGDSRQVISQRFENWVKRRHFRTYLDAEQSPDILEDLEGGNGMIQAMSSAPNGRVLMYRSIVRNTGQRRLYLVDHRRAQDPKRVAADGKPGVETLHPIAGRNFDVANDSFAFVARDDARDVIYWQPYSRKVTRGEAEQRPPPPEVAQRNGAGPAAQDEPESRVRKVSFDVGDRVKYRLESWDIVAVDTLALAPDGRRIVFVGLREGGQKDLFLLDPDAEADRFTVRRLTDDVYSEREVSWGPEGIIFTSDATEHGHYNLFRIDPETSAIERVTFEQRDHNSPRMLPDGRVFFVAYDELGANVYQAVGPGLTQKTGLATGLSDLGPAPGDDLWALRYHRGEQRPARLPADRLMESEISTQPVQAVAYSLPNRSLEEAERYSAWDVDNWQLGTIFGIVGASSYGVAGQIYATSYDKLRDHTIILNMLATGDVRSIDGSLFYINQEDRIVWGGGLFQDVGYRLDRTFEDDPDAVRFISSERFFGVTGTARYPFTRFSFIQGSLAVGGLDFFVREGTENCLRTPSCIGRTDAFGDWQEANQGVRFQAEPAVSLGHNTLRYHPMTGPIMGHSLLLTNRVNVQPFRQRGYSTIRLDAEKYWSIYGRTHFKLRGGSGYTFGDRFARSFFLSSFDTLRGVQWGDFDFLLGRSFFFTTAELAFPLNFLVKVPIFDIEGIAGLDFGAAGDGFDEVWDRRVFNAVVGTNFGLGPFVFRLHFAKPFDIGAVTPQGGDWNTNFSLSWRYW